MDCAQVCQGVNAPWKRFVGKAILPWLRGERVTFLPEYAVTLFINGVVTILKGVWGRWHAEGDTPRSNKLPERLQGRRRLGPSKKAGSRGRGKPIGTKSSLAAGQQTVSELSA
jgi:hypothetical protein